MHKTSKEQCSEAESENAEKETGIFSKKSRTFHTTQDSKRITAIKSRSTWLLDANLSQSLHFSCNNNNEKKMLWKNQSFGCVSRMINRMMSRFWLLPWFFGHFCTTCRWVSIFSLSLSYLNNLDISIRYLMCALPLLSPPPPPPPHWVQWNNKKEWLFTDNRNTS